MARCPKSEEREMDYGDVLSSLALTIICSGMMSYKASGRRREIVIIALQRHVTFFIDIGKLQVFVAVVDWKFSTVDARNQTSG
jgi:hypothetical protein